MSGYNVGQVESLLTTSKDRSNLVKSRDKWGRQAEFVLTLVGFAVGLGNVWRFPYLAYKNGGGAFLIPYILSLVFMGIPLFCLEVTFGQFASMGPLSIWAINPLFKGLGYTMVILSAVITIYYNVVVAQCIYFFFASLTTSLPWVTCDNPWNTCHCISSIANATAEAVLKQTGLNCTGVNISMTTARTSTEEYYYRHVLEKSSGLDVPGNIKWDLTGCNLLMWIIIALALCRGVKTMGKVAYFFSIFPYILLTIMLIRGVTLEGHEIGIAYYLSPDLSKLKDSKVWLDAASQIFFSVSACTGSLTAMASYNKFNNNTIRDSIVIPIINCLTSFYAGFAIFSTLGFMAHYKNVGMENVTDQGTGLVFVVYPEALSHMPVAPLWASLFFLMMTCLGLSTQFPSFETCLTAFQDEFAILRKGRWRPIIFRVSACALMFILGIPETTQGGQYLLDLLNNYVAGLPLLLVGFFETIAIIHVYGHKRFSEDVRMMMGYSPVAMAIYKYYFHWNFVIVCPLMLLAIILFDCIQYVPVYVSDPGYPEWAETLVWVLILLVVGWIPGWYIVIFFRQGGFTLLKRINTPTADWGPLLPENRTGVYAEKDDVVKVVRDGDRHIPEVTYGQRVFDAGGDKETDGGDTKL